MELNQDPTEDNVVDQENVVEQNYLRNIRSFDSSMIFNAQLALQDVPNESEQFIKKTREILEVMQQHINTVSNATIANEASAFAGQLKQRVLDIADKEEERKKLHGQLWDVTVEVFGELENKSLIFNGALALSKILQAIVSPDAKLSSNFIKLLLHVLSILSERKASLDMHLSKWHKILNEMQVNSQVDLYQILMPCQKISKYSILSNLQKQKPEYLTELTNSYKELILNDANKLQDRQILFFAKYLGEVTQEVFTGELLPHIDFNMKRNGELISTIAETIGYFDKVDFTPEIVLSLTQEVLTRDYLTKDETSQQAMKYCENVAKMVKSQEALDALLLTYLLKGFQDSRNSQLTATQRQKYFQVIRQCIYKAKKECLSQESLQKITTALLDFVFSIKEEAVLKEAFTDYASILKKNEKLELAADQVKNLSLKMSNYWQVALIPEGLSSFKESSADLFNAIKGKAVQMLNSENYSSNISYSSILSLGNFFVQAYKLTGDKQFIQPLLDNSNFLQYMASESGFVNTDTFFKKQLGSYEITWHIRIITNLLIQKYQNSLSSFADGYLLDTLFEYAFNSGIVFNQSVYFSAIEQICSELQDKIVPNVLQHLYLKIKQLYKRVIASQVVQQGSEEQNKSSEECHRSIVEVRMNELAPRISKMTFIMKTLLQNSQKELEKEQFMTLLKTICHPLVSQNLKELLKMQGEIEKALNNKVTPFSKYFQLYCPELVQENLTNRNGILSSHAVLKGTAINILTLLGFYGHLSVFVGKLVKVLDYKPLELTTKLQRLFEKEFDRITYYDLMFYSEMTKDMMKIFEDSDKSAKQKEESTSINENSASNKGEQSQTEEEKKGEEEEGEDDIDYAKLLQQQLKKNQDNKKKGGAKKAPAKAPAKPVKQASQSSSQPQAKKTDSKKQAAEQQQPQLTKEQRNKMDRDQIRMYFEQIQTVKSRQIATVQTVIYNIACCKQAFEKSVDEEMKWRQYNYMDILLLEAMQANLKLLNFPASKFSTLNFFQNLFASDKTGCFFKIKNLVVNSILAIATNRMLQKNMREFQIIFQHLEDNASFADMDKGHLQFILSMTNFVLKDLSVHLSTKEQALQVTLDILESNNKVQNIDLVRVTINMMKSSYNNDNLSIFLRKLFQRISKEELALILQRLFQYEPTPKQKILEELIKMDQQIFQPDWLASQLWILHYDDENNKKAKRLWEKNKFELKQSAIQLKEEEKNQNIFHYLRSKNTSIFYCSISAMVAAIDKFQDKSDIILEDVIEFYNSEIDMIEKASIQQAIQNNQQQVSDTSKKIIADERFNRIATPEIIKKAAPLVKAHSFQKIFEFLIVQGCQDISEDVRNKSSAAALSVIQEKGKLYAEEILKILDKFIHDGKKYSEQSKIHAIINIGVLSNYLDQSSQKNLQNTFEKMLELLSSPSEPLKHAVCRCISQIARFFPERAKKFFDDNFSLLLNSDDEKCLRGAAFTCAGLAKGLGQFDGSFLEKIQSECFHKHADTCRKLAGLYFYDAMSVAMGKHFEMYAKTILPQILACISDQREVVRKAATATNKELMSKFSNYAIKQVLPIFLQGLENDQWRSKLASVEALGNMAYCAPKQIAGFLPQIVKGIREVLNDTHEKVHEAALQAITNIGSVIKCPEIADILDTLIRALQNPNAHLKDALKMLLETSFVHAIDAPSLSLLVPILDSGLMMHDNESKQLASRLMGSICNLTQDPSDLLPYMKILRPAINNSLFDSIPEIRASAAKALGSLSRGLGLENSLEMLDWARAVLHKKNLSTSERQGAAQGFAEIISMHGIPFFEQTIKEILEKSADQDASLRESYRSVMVFLPTSFDHYVNYLPKLLPTMISGLSDDHDEVRKVSMRSVKTCIRLYAKQAPNQLVLPILNMMFDKDFRVRQSSSTLMYQLVKELENDIIKLQPKYISHETKNEILSAMFILKYDVIEKVAIQASQIWKNIIDNPLKVLRQIIEDLTRITFKIIQNEYSELQEMGLNCMRGMAEKFGEKVINDSLGILETYQESKVELPEVLALAKIVLGMVGTTPLKLLNEFRGRYLQLIDPYLSHQEEEPRAISAQVVVTILHRTFEPVFMTQTMDKLFLKKLHGLVVTNKQDASEWLIDSLKKILNSGIELKLEDKLINLCGIKEMKESLTVAKSKILKAVAPKIALTLFKRKLYQQVMDVLIEELFAETVDDAFRIDQVLQAFSELIAHIPEEYMLSINDQINQFYNRCQESNRLSFYVDLIAYFCAHSGKNYEGSVKEYLRNVLVMMNDSDDKLLEKVNICVNAIYGGLSKESQFYLVPVVRSVIENLAVEEIGLRGIYKKKVETLKLFEKPAGIKSFVSVIQNSIMHGSLEIRTDSAACFKYMIDFSKAESLKGDLIKICGALIRVVNDKFPADLKMQIFHTLRLMLLKSSAAIKPMAPQLQTTFLKAFSDNLATSELRKLVIENLLLLVKTIPKVDPIVKELNSMLEGEKVEREAKVEVAEALAVIIRLHGKSIQAPLVAAIKGTLESILKSKREQFNDKTLLNCGVAMGFLTVVTAEGTGNVNEMFEEFDTVLDLRLSFGIKFGLVMSGHPQLDQAAAMQKLSQYTLEWLTNSSGIKEVGGDPWVPYDFAGTPEEGGQLVGSLEFVTHLCDVFLRRFGSPDLSRLVFGCLNQSGIFEKLNKMKGLSMETKGTLDYVMSNMPVQLLPNGSAFDEQVAIFLQACFIFVHKFYLEYSFKNELAGALRNLLLLNYNNFTDVKNVEVLTIPMAKEQVAKECFSSVISSDMKMIAVELLFM